MNDNDSNDGKREIKIYQKVYRLPVLAGGKVEQLQKQIRQRNDHLTQGRLVVKKVEQRGFLGKKIVKERVRQPLSFEERYNELKAIVENYDGMVAVLKRYQYDYQLFFQELAEEIRGIIFNNCTTIAQKEQKRQNKVQEERKKANPNPQILSVLSGMERQLLDIAKPTGYAAVLMLKKLDSMGKSLELIANDQQTQRKFLASFLTEIRSQKDLYELQLEINALQADTAKLVDIALNLDEYMKPFMGNFQALLENVAQVDKELSKAMGEIDNIARLLEAQQFGNFERDPHSQRIADFLVMGELKKDRLQEALEQIETATTGFVFDAELLGTGNGVTIDDCLGNIREFVGLKLDNLTVIDIPAEEVPEIYSFDKEDPPQPPPTPTPPRRDERGENIINRGNKQAQSFQVDLGKGVTMDMVAIPGGSFFMGSPEGEGSDDEHPQHLVTIPPFYMGKYQVTQAQWQAVMSSNPSEFKAPNNPVERVSWDDCVEFCKKLSAKTGLSFRLPSEAEWEYACRSVNSYQLTVNSEGLTAKEWNQQYNQRYYFGDNEAELEKYAWYDKNSGSRTHPVGKKLPNKWGLYDMHGNVWEWCADSWHESYAEKPEELKNNGSIIWLSSNITNRVIRGGSWDNISALCRAAYRSYLSPAIRYNNVGFRVVCSVFPGFF